ncbi:hypothetical protein AGMMS50239_24590 [Bacteroidia bacterium]|nr:hypothetical protein AGMMS50239_24590 [Bacteroidia bacterium]
MVNTLVRRYIDIANEMTPAGYTPEEAAEIKKQVDFYNDLKDEIKLKSGDALDLKLYDPAMRQLIDNYVRAEDSEQLLNLEDISFLDMMEIEGENAIDKLPKNIKNNEKSVAEVLREWYREELKQTLVPGIFETDKNGIVDGNIYTAHKLNTVFHCSSPNF